MGEISLHFTPSQSGRIVSWVRDGIEYEYLSEAIEGERLSTAARVERRGATLRHAERLAAELGLSR